MHCVVHGVPLPPLGSFEYQLLETGLARQRAEKVALARLFTSLVGPMSGLEQPQLDLLLTSYTESVLQIRYNYKYTPAQVRVLEERRSLQQEDAQIMDKVASWTVTGKK